MAKAAIYTEIVPGTGIERIMLMNAFNFVYLFHNTLEFNYCN